MALDGATIEQDLGRRDLTVNAIAEPRRRRRAVDPFGGIGGSPRRAILRAVSGDRVRSTIRCGSCGWRGWPASWSFEIELGTAEAARAVAPRLAAVSPERVFEELNG